jgi:probable F420-dependent oxidoreductase
MHFGITAPYRQGPLETGEYAAGFARLVEAAGFESLWAVEHVVMCVDYESTYPYDPSGRSPFGADTVQPDPLIWLSFVSAATTRLRLGTAVLILPQHNPVILAKSVASLDRLSNGRLLLGIGVGWVKEEAVAVGASFHDRGRRANEYIRAMRTLWREPVARFEGEFVRFSGVVSEPRPVRPGGVPIHVGGHSHAAARRAGSLGDGFYPLGVDPERLGGLLGVMEEAARGAGREPSTIEITCSGPARPDLAARYRDAGADRMVVFPPTGDLEKLRGFLDGFRRDAIEKLA